MCIRDRVTNLSMADISSESLLLLESKFENYRSIQPSSTNATQNYALNQSSNLSTNGSVNESLNGSLNGTLNGTTNDTGNQSANGNQTTIPQSMQQPWVSVYLTFKSPIPTGCLTSSGDYNKTNPSNFADYYSKVSNRDLLNLSATTYQYLSLIHIQMCIRDRPTRF